LKNDLLCNLSIKPTFIDYFRKIINGLIAPERLYEKTSIIIVGNMIMNRIKSPIIIISPSSFNILLPTSLKTNL